MKTSFTRHFRIASATSLKTLFFEQIDSSEERFNESIYLGCFYINGERQNEACNLKVGDYVRIHTKPKRYNIKSFTKSDLIFADEDDFWIIKKPHFLPVHDTLDNNKENLLRVLQGLLGVEVYLTQRLDIETAGLLFFAKNKTAQSHFNRLLAERKVEKLYEAKAEGLVPPGTYVDYMEKRPRAPKILVNEATYLNEPSLYQRCEMQVMAVSKEANHYNHSIRLITGRSHQIRAQMAKRQAPILNDCLYGAYACEGFGLRSVKLAFEWNNHARCFEL